MKELRNITHTFDPVWDQNSRILILGTMPSEKSRELGFYYGHPRNRFWKVVSEVYGDRLPVSNEEKKAFALAHHIAIWDVLKSCDIYASDDSSIKNPVANDMNQILSHAPIRKIITTGTKATELYRTYCYPHTGIASIMLASTSPANCGMPYEVLLERYRTALEIG